MNASIAIAARGEPGDRANWSGTPNGLAGGLEELGFDVRHVSAELGPLLNRAGRFLRHEHRVALRTSALRLRLGRARPVSGVVQIGTEFTVTSRSPVATFEDSTVRQHVDLGTEWIMRLPRRSIDAWIERQRRSYEDASACCVMSRWAAESLIDDYGVPPDKVHVVGAGPNHVVEPSPARDWSTPRFLFVGREPQRKNLPRVLQAFSALRHELPDARLDVVGGALPVESPGVTVHGLLRLSMPSERARLEQLLRETTCLVMPSFYEPFGIAYVEAGRAGLPSIGTTIGGAPEAIGPGGRTVDPKNEAQLLSAMRELAEGKTAARLGKLAREHVRQFTWRLVAERVVSALKLEELSG